MRRLGLVLLLIAAVGVELELLGRDHPSGPAAAQPTAERGLTLLDYWTQELVPGMLLERALERALRDHEGARAARLERRIRRHLVRVRGFGLAGAHEMQAVRATGAAWTRWAVALMRPSARPHEVARLERNALRLHQAAYAVVDAAILRAARSP